MSKCGECDKEFKNAHGLSIHNYIKHGIRGATKKGAVKGKRTYRQRATEAKYPNFYPCCGTNIKAVSVAMSL